MANTDTSYSKRLFYIAIGADLMQPHIVKFNHPERVGGPKWSAVYPVGTCQSKKCKLAQAFCDKLNNAAQKRSLKA